MDLSIVDEIIRHAGGRNVLDAPQKLLYRNLLYTAVTRAKRLLIAVGSRELLQKMVQNNRKTLRYTSLTQRLAESFEKNV